MADQTPKSAAEREHAAFKSPIPHVADLGIELIEAGGGVAVMRLPYQERLVGNPETGVLHGGVVTTLIDTVAGVACLSGLDTPQPIATLDLRIDYLRPATPRVDLFARAEAYKMTRQVVFMRANAYQEGSDDLVANAVATFMMTGRLGPRGGEDDVRTGAGGGA